MAGKNTRRWEHLIEEAILNLLAEHREVDIEGLMHVLQKNRIRVQLADVNAAIATLSKEGRVQVDLEAESKNPVIRLKSPFVPWM